MMTKPRAKPPGTSGSAVNKLRIRIPMLLEAEGEGIIPVVGVLAIFLLVVGWIALR